MNVRTSRTNPFSHVAIAIACFFAMLFSTAALADSGIKSPPPSAEADSQNKDFSGCVEKFIDDHDYPADIKQKDSTSTQYSYAWFTFTVPRLLTISSASYTHDMAINERLFTPAGFSQYRLFIESQSGFKKFILSQKGAIFSFLQTAPRLNYNARIAMPLE